MIHMLYSWIIFGLYVSLGCFLCLLGLLYVLQRRLLYVPDYPEDSREKASLWDPSAFGLSPHVGAEGEDGDGGDWLQGYRVMHFESLDGVQLMAYWIPYDHAKEVKEVNHAKDLPILYFFHANAGNVGQRVPIIRALMLRWPCHAFMLSYRGYGASLGSPSQAGLQMDALAGLNLLTRRILPALLCGEREREPGAKVKVKPVSHPSPSIVLYGQSLGCAVALHLAAQAQAQPFIAALVLENPFVSLAVLLQSLLPRPVAMLCPLLLRDPWHNLNALRSLGAAKKCIPILFLSGQQDELIPCSHAQTLFSSYSRMHEHKLDQDQNMHRNSHSRMHESNNAESDTLKLGKNQLTCFSKGHHNDTCLQSGYFETMADFLNQILAE